MKNRINRRDFLKILGLLPFTHYNLFLRPPEIGRDDITHPSILIIVFDAFSTHNISLYGYPRKTTPYLEQLANRATVYHNHYAAGNFTTSGTASLLTGTYPWTHRAIQINGKVQKEFQNRNIFHLFNDFYRISYSHNQLVNIIQDQFVGDIDFYKLREDLTLGNNKWLLKLFKNDLDAATVSWARISGQIEDNLNSSLVLANYISLFNQRKNKLIERDYPRGLPISSLDNFLLEDAVNWLQSAIADFPIPFLGYFHFLPPHAPYNTRIDFIDAFSEVSIPRKTKPRHPLAKVGRAKQPYGLAPSRRTYDEYILYVDSEFNRLFKKLEKSGILDNTYLILTSDHGEMFERGILGHTTPSLHDPVVRVPLMIFEPGQTDRRDVYTKTSAVDLLPTLLELTGKPIPPWVEGVVLPPYLPAYEEQSVFAMEAKTNKPTRPLTSASAMIVKGKYKLTKYFGYKYLPKSNTLVELYDIDNDPEELNELSGAYPQITNQLLEELEGKLRSADEPYT
jgi:choline-sulfatase